MKKSTKIIKKLNMRVRSDFISNKFMESSKQAARDKFNNYMNECKNYERFCDTKRSKEILEETINILENRYNDYIKFHNIESEV